MKILAIYVSLIVMVAGCGDDGSPLEPAPDLGFRFLSGFLGSDLQPEYPPDPIEGTMRVEISNLTDINVSNVRIPWAEVILADSSQRLGRIEFSTDWDGELNPRRPETITLTKIEASVTLFEPPCSRKILLRFSSQHEGKEIETFDSDTLTFGCVF